MTKRRSIISYEKLTSEQKKKLDQDFPEGFLGSLSTMKTPLGEMFDGLLWETEEIIYLVRINKAAFTTAVSDDDDDDFEDDDLDEDITAIEKEEVEADDEEEEEDKPSDDDEDDDDED